MAQALPESAGGGARLQRRQPHDPTGTPPRPWTDERRPAPKKVRRGGWAVSLAAMACVLAGASGAAPAPDERAHGVWMIEDEVAIDVARCGGESLCGRIVWLRDARDDAGRPRRDGMNPDAALRARPLCGLTVLDGLLPVPDEPDRWNAGSFYDPRNGRDYGLLATLASADVLVARVYIGMPFLGLNQTLLRIPRGSGEGWC